MKRVGFRYKSRRGSCGFNQWSAYTAYHGAAAFLMVEYVGISYVEVSRRRYCQPGISTPSLIYIVHLEACKAWLAHLVAINTNYCTKPTLFHWDHFRSMCYQCLGLLRCRLDERCLWRSSNTNRYCGAINCLRCSGSRISKIRQLKAAWRSMRI